jgi:hypothetical protein
VVGHARATASEGIESFVEISFGGLVSLLPAGIVTKRATRPSTVAPVVDDAAVFAYFDEENKLHVLV